MRSYKNYTNWKKRLIFFTTAVMSLTVSASAQVGDDDRLEEVEGFTVTGSRIKQLDLQTINPVIRLDAAAIEATGFTTIGEAVRSLPFNNGQALTPTDSGTSFTPGVSTANLRGLGNNNTLVLINGRRAAPYASPGFNGFQTVFDLNSIPAAAIDNIEILKDGASAVYGSDAVAGVMNVSLRNDYEGATVTGMVGNYFSTDGMLLKGSFITGANTAKTSVVMTFDWQEQEAVFARDLDISKDADQTSRASKASPRYTVTGYEEAGFASAQEYLDTTLPLIEFTNPIDDGYLDNRSSRGFPGDVYIDSSESRFTFAEPTDTPDVADAIGGRNLYNYQERNGLFPENRMYSFYTRGQHNITDNLYAFAEVSFSRSEASVNSAPTPVDIETSQGLYQGTQLTIPAYNAYNPWNEDITNGRRRMVEPANRINEVTSDTPRFVLGMGGDIESSAIEDWSWESAVLYTKNTVNNLNANSIPDYRLQQALNGLTRLGDGSLTWDENTELTDRVYYNWFGTNEEAMSEFLSVYNPNSASLQYQSFDVNTNGRIAGLELPGGLVGFNVGAERRIEDFENIKSDLNATGMILGGSEGTSSIGSRDLNSIYGELLIPVVDQLEIQLAGRWEQYSDEGFDGDFRPKVGVLFRPTEWLSIRGSYSESFKAPDLAYLYTASQTSFSSFQVTDPVTGTEIDQIQVVTAGNPDLKPETSDTYYVGFTLEPTGKLQGLRLYFDYLEWQQEDLLAQLSDFYGYAEFLTEAAAGNPTFAGAVVRDSATNEVLYIRDDYANISTGSYIGYDMGASYDWSTEVGDFYVQLNSTYVREQKIDGSDIVGSYLSPEWRHTLTTNYTYGDWQASLLGIYIDGRQRNLALGTVYREGDTLYLTYDVDSQIVWNASVSYSGLWDTKVTLGVNNLLDEEPPVDPFDALGTTPGVNLPEPAFWYLRLERSF
jgi:outer membrane receptor protein involved in Fe transport